MAHKAHNRLLYTLAMEMDSSANVQPVSMGYVQREVDDEVHDQRQLLSRVPSQDYRRLDHTSESTELNSAISLMPSVVSQDDDHYDDCIQCAPVSNVASSSDSEEAVNSPCKLQGTTPGLATPQSATRRSPRNHKRPLYSQDQKSISRCPPKPTLPLSASSTNPPPTIDRDHVNSRMSERALNRDNQTLCKTNQALLRGVSKIQPTCAFRLKDELEHHSETSTNSNPLLKNSSQKQMYPPTPDRTPRGDLTTDSVAEQIVLLFPNVAQNENYSTLNCIAAPIFATFSLFYQLKYGVQPSMIDNSSSQPPPYKRPRPTDFPNQCRTAACNLNCIQPLLSSLVELEVTLLQSNTSIASCQSSQPFSNPKRRVHFPAFDGSALIPPSDVVEGSHQHQQAAILGLTKIMQAIHNVSISETFSRQHDQCNSTRPSALLSTLAEYLRGTTFRGHHAALCCQLLSSSDNCTIDEFPIERILKAADSYAKDFDSLASSMEHMPSVHVEPPLKEGKLSSINLTEMALSWSTRLADASAQLVRYWLRTQLNPIPDRAPSNVTSAEWNRRVSDIVSLDTNTKIANTAVDDGSLSSLVSNATSEVYAYFGADWKQWKSRLEDTPECFLQNSELAKCGIAISSKQRIPTKAQQGLKDYTPTEWKHVEEQVEHATAFLAAIHGATFLYELFNIIANHSEQNFLASWERTIQASAAHLYESVPVKHLQPQDAHLVLLRYPPAIFLEQLPSIIDETRRNACQAALERIPQIFLFSTDGDAKATRRKRAYQPHVAALQHAFECAISKTVFPSVTAGAEQ